MILCNFFLLARQWYIRVVLHQFMVGSCYQHKSGIFLVELHNITCVVFSSAYVMFTLHEKFTVVHYKQRIQIVVSFIPISHQQRDVTT